MRLQFFIIQNIFQDLQIFSFSKTDLKNIFDIRTFEWFTPFDRIIVVYIIDFLFTTLIVDESVSLDAQPVPEVITEGGWEEMPAPVDEEKPAVEDEYLPEVSRPMEEDRVDLEAELARLDAQRNLRGETTPEVKVDPHLAALENQLSELDF